MLAVVVVVVVGVVIVLVVGVVVVVVAVIVALVLEVVRSPTRPCPTSAPLWGHLASSGNLAIGEDGRA